MIESKMVNGVYVCRFINDKTGECEHTISIPKEEFEKLAAASSKRERDALESKAQETTLSKVPLPIRNNIRKIIDRLDGVMKRFYELSSPMINNLISMSIQEKEIISNCDAHWTALSALNFEQAIKHWKAATDGFMTRAKLLEDYKKIAYNTKPHIEAMEKGIKLLADMVVKINQTTAPEAYKLYNELYNVTNDEINVCMKYHADIAIWEKTEGQLLAKANEKYDFIKEVAAKHKPGSSNQPSDSKQDSIQQVPIGSPSTSRSNSEVKENDSPSHSSNNSSNGSPKSQEDSPPFYPHSPDNAKLSSLPQALLGSNSEAVQKQKLAQAALAQKNQNPPPVNPSWPGK